MIIWVFLILLIFDKFFFCRIGVGCCILLVNEGVWIFWFIGLLLLIEEYVFGIGKMFLRIVFFFVKWKLLYLYKFLLSFLL